MSLEESFKKIQGLIDEIDPNKPDRKVVHVFKLKVTEGDSVVKTMMIDLVNIKFYEGDDDAECTFILDEQTLSEIISKTADSVEYLTSGKLKVEGNVELAKLLAQVLSQ